ncbi:DUF2933 domain-containing protein [Rhodophyticola sp.]|jgi:uncharacterized ion transporter superfamily protein YfcC|uniref:DUF2933 domain-containing protein n=1 Tax=Rhodophyticola sp. TaxID=2680032 RepID=UPI003D273A9A
MIIPIAAFFIAGGTVSGVTENLAVFAPLLLCVGAHLLLHRFIGGLCHGHGSKRDEAAETVSPHLRHVTQQGGRTAHLRVPTVEAEQS